MYKETVWSRRYAQRYQWAYAAYKRFMEEVDQELVEDFQRTEHVTVVVYGCPQVGKTTLILDLLGVKAIAQVAHVLRGGQALGKASTASPIRYGKSGDNHWYIGGDPLGLDDTQAEHRFRSIRAEVEAGNTSSIEILSVRIPEHFFEPLGSDSLSLDLRMLDIPGISARNAAERALVEKIAQEHVATADLILMVGRADQLGFLNPNAIGLDALSDWMLQLNRFRVVLTYTFSPASFKEWFGKKQYDASAVKSHLYSEITTHDFRAPQGHENEFERNIFPLEFGDSLEGLRQDKDGDRYYSHAVSVISDLRSQLLRDIESAASPYARLQSAFQIGKFIEAKVQHQRKEHIHQIRALRNEAYKLHAKEKVCITIEEGMQNRKQIAERILNKYAFRIKKFKRKEKMMPKKCVAWNLYFQKPILTCTSRNVSSLRDCAKHMELDLTRAWTYFCSRVSHQHGIGILELNPPSTKLVAPFIQRLNGYMLDKYWSGDNFLSDFNDLQEICTNLHTQFIDAARQAFMLELEKEYQKADKAANQADALYRAACKQSQLAGDSLRKLKQQIDETSKIHQAFMHRMGSSIAHAETFKQYIYEAFGTELAQVRHLIKYAEQPTERLINLFYLPVLLAELPKMLSGSKF